MIRHLIDIAFRSLASYINNNIAKERSCNVKLKHNAVQFKTAAVMYKAMETTVQFCGREAGNYYVREEPNLKQKIYYWRAKRSICLYICMVELWNKILMHPRVTEI